MAILEFVLALAWVSSAKGQSIVYTKADLDSYIAKWAIGDGEAAHVISDYFCEFEIANPRDFFSVMVKDGVLDQWMDKLGDLSFVDSGEDCLNRRCLRDHMVTALKYFEPGSDKELGRARQKLLDRLKSIRVRRVN